MVAMLIALVAAHPVVAPSRACPTPAAERIAAREPVRVRPLNEMPPAKQLLGVYRSVDGCPKPIVVRDQVGQPARKRPAGT